MATYTKTLTPPRIPTPSLKTPLADLKKTNLSTYNLSKQNLSTHNLGTMNLATHNLSNNNYLTYKLNVDTDKLQNMFREKPPYVPSPLQQQMDKRMEYSFDYNNANQVNSYADVIMRTLTNVGRTMRGMKTLDQTLIDFGTDTYNLFYRGTWQPLINKDWGVLLANQFVNFRETVDLVDNVWKGFAIGGQLSLMNGGNFNWEGAKEGMRKAIVDRENYDFDTGSKGMDMFLEMATPTNIALLLLSGGTGNVAKAAAKEAGETGIKKGLVKSFGKHYTSQGLDATFKAMGRNLTKAEIASLTNISKHVKNLELLSSVNKMKKAIDIVDKIGPQLAIKTTVGIPWGVIKATSGASNSVIRYFATAVENVQAGNPRPGVISTMMHRPEYELLFDNMATAIEIMKDKQMTVVFDDIISGVANSDNNVLKNAYDVFYKTATDKKLIEAYIDEVFNNTGKFTPFDIAQREFRAKSVDGLVDVLNKFATDASGGMYKTFEEYSNVIHILNEVSGETPGMKALYGTIQNIEKQMHIVFVQDTITEVRELIYGASNIVNQVKATKKEMKSLNLFEEQKLVKELDNIILKKGDLYMLDLETMKPIYLSRLIDIKDELVKYKDLVDPDTYKETMEKELTRLEKLRTNAYKAYQKAKKLDPSVTYDPKVWDEQIEAIPKLIQQNAKDNVDYAYFDRANLLHQQKELRKLFHGALAGMEEWEKLDLRELNLHQKIESLRTDLIPDGFTFAPVDPIESIEKLIDYSVQIERILDAGTDLTEINKTMYNDILEFIDFSIDELVRGAGRTNLDIYKGTKNIADYGRELENSFTLIQEKLEMLPINLLKDTSFGAGMKEMTANMYGKSVLGFANHTLENLEKQFGSHVKDSFKEFVDKTFYKDGAILEAEYEKFLTNLNDTLDIFTEEMFRELGEYRSYTLTFADMTFEFNNTVTRLRDRLNAMTHDFYNSPTGKPKIDASIIQTTLEDLDTLKYNIDSTMKAVNSHLEHVKQSFNLDPKNVASVQKEVDLATGDTVDKIHKVLFGEISTPESIGISRRVWVYVTNGKLDQHVTDPLEKYAALKRKGGIMTADELSQLKNTEPFIKHLYEWDRFVDNANIRSTKLKKLQRQAEGVFDFRAALEAVDKLQQTIGFSADMELAFSKDVLTEYTLKLNTTLKNLHLLQNEQLMGLLEAVRAKDYAEMPILESLESMSRYDVSSMRTVQNYINTIDFPLLRQAMKEGDLNYLSDILYSDNYAKFNDAYIEYFGRAFDPLADSISEFATAIDTIIEVQKAATTMMDTMYGMVSVVEFYDSVNVAITKGLDQTVANTFLDAIQRTYDNPASLITLAEINDNPALLEFEYNKIFKNMEMQLRNQSSPYNMKLGNWYDWYTTTGEIAQEDLDLAETLFGKHSRMQHTASFDAWSDHIIHKYLLQDGDAKSKYFAVDIEASGTNKTTSTIYQKSVIQPETGIFKWYINSGVADHEFPDEDHVFHLLFGDGDHHLGEIDDLKTLFKRIYQNPDKVDAEKQLREFFGIENSPIEIIMADSEADLIKMSSEFIETQKPPRGKLMYRMHNGLGYDMPVINNRARYHNVKDVRIGAHKVQDTQILLEEALGIRRLTAQEMGTIEDLVYGHIVRRNAELSAIGLRRQLGTNSVNINENLSKFLPTMDAAYMDAHDKLIEIFQNTSGKLDADKIGSEIMPAGVGARELMKQFTESTQQFYYDLRDLQRMGRRLNRFRITVNADDITQGNRVLPKDYGKNIPKELLSNHIGMDLATMNTVSGVYIPIMGVNKHAAPNLAYEYFDTGGQLITDRNIKQMTQMAGNIQRTISYINNPHAIDAMDLNSIHRIHDILIDHLKQFAGESYFDPIFGYLKKGETQLRSFATTNELFKAYTRLSNGVIAEVMDENGVYRLPLIKQLLEDPDLSEITLHLINNKQIFKNSLSEYGIDRLYFTLEPKPGDAKAIFDYWGNLTGKSIMTLAELEEAQDLLQFTRLKRIASVYRGMQDSFNTFHNVTANTVDYVAKLISEGHIKDAPSGLENATYSTLRIMTESYDSLISFSKLQQVLEFTPEQLASYLRHQAKGGVVFQNSSLWSKNYFPRRGLAKMSDIMEMDLAGTLQHLLSQKDTLEELGIGIKTFRDETIIYVKDIAKIADAKYTPFMDDFDMSDWIQIIVDAGLRDAGEVGDFMRDADYQGILKALNEVNTSRANLTRLMPDASTSTLEVLDEIAMERILEKVHGKVPDFLDLKTMQKYAMFEGNSFNHSILGHIDGRRMYMDYASFNPAKTMYNATSMVEKHLGAQVQLLELVQTPEFKLENFVSTVAGDGKMPIEDVITYLNQSHLKVAFLNDKSTPDMPNFKLSAVTIKSKKDVDFALRMGATVIDTQTYNEAYKIINNYRIRNGLAEFLDKVLVAPFKIGWMMWNYGVVGRNIVDTVGKNVTTTKDMAIIPAMAQMTKDYFTYKNVLTDIYKYAQQQNIHIDVAVDEFFAKNAGKVDISLEAFNLITEYQKAGGSVGLSQEVMDYYGDSIDRMFRNVNEEESGLSKTDFRHMMQMPDDIAEQWLLEKFPTDLARVEMLMDSKYDLLIYKRAYAMHKAYKGSGLSVNDLVTYLKSGRIEPGFEQVLPDLLEKTKGVSLQDTMFTKAMNHPFIANSLDWNMASEEILRLSMFKYMRETGYNTVETMGEIARTHFDYGKKHWAQMYMEMAMPFSTFKIMSLMYWVEEMSNNAGSVEILADAWSNLAHLPDRQPEDAMLRRNLRYQMYTGNMILNEETGLTAKINPTPIDMMNFFMNPVEYIEGMFHSGGHAVKDLLQAEPYENESELSFYKRKQRLAFDMIPLLGGNINKIRKAYEDARPRDDKNKKQETEPASMGQFILNLALSPLFNTTWTPEQGGEWKRFGAYQKKVYPTFKYNYPKYKKYQNYRPSGRYGGYKKRYYPKQDYARDYRPTNVRRHKDFIKGYQDWSRYSTYNKTMTMPQFKFSRGSAYPTKASRSLNYAFSSVWRRSMTKKGNAKYKFMGFPTNKWTLKIKIQMLRNITSYNRWA